MISEDRLYIALGNNLRELREGKVGSRPKLTQAELAKRVGLERTSITNIEKGNQKVSLHVLYRLCEVLKADVASVLPHMNDVQAGLTEQHLQDVEFGGTVHKLHPRTVEVLSAVVSRGGFNEND